jgi:hypothetical protein
LTQSLWMAVQTWARCSPELDGAAQTQRTLGALPAGTAGDGLERGWRDRRSPHAQFHLGRKRSTSRGPTPACLERARGGCPGVSRQVPWVLPQSRSQSRPSARIVSSACRRLTLASARTRCRNRGRGLRRAGFYPCGHSG